MALAPSFDLVLVPSSCDHRAVDADLVAGIVADERGGDDLDALTLADAFEAPLPSIAFLVAVAQFDGLVLAGGGAGGHRGAAEGAAGEFHVDFDGRIAAGIDDFAGSDGSVMVVFMS
jgi:hypothetical protein